MKAMFALYLGVIVFGLVFAIAVGLSAS